MDLCVQPGDQTPEHSMEEYNVAEDEKSTTVEVQRKSNVDHILRCEEDCPLQVLAIETDDQPACLQILRC